MTSFSSSGISGSSNGSLLSTQDHHHHHSHYNAPMRVHFTDGSVGGSSVINTKQGISKVCFNQLYSNTKIIISLALCSVFHTFCTRCLQEPIPNNIPYNMPLLSTAHKFNTLQYLKYNLIQRNTI